jgi:hypothetical protein
LAVTMRRRHRVVIAAIAHQRCRGDVSTPEQNWAGIPEQY